MKIAKYTLYVEIYDYDQITTEELQAMIDDELLSKSAINGMCLLVEEKSKMIDTTNMTDEELDNRPLNFRQNFNNPEVWEQELDKSTPLEQQSEI